MDGISGIVIGNVFRVEKTKLPIGYQEDDIAFCVLSEDQKITAGQDWTTDFSGQMILLDVPNEESDEDIDLDLLNKPRKKRKVPILL